MKKHAFILILLAFGLSSCGSSQGGGQQNVPLTPKSNSVSVSNTPNQVTSTSLTSNHE